VERIQQILSLLFCREKKLRRFNKNRIPYNQKKAQRNANKHDSLLVLGMDGHKVRVIEANTNRDTNSLLGGVTMHTAFGSKHCHKSVTDFEFFENGSKAIAPDFCQ